MSMRVLIGFLMAGSLLPLAEAAAVELQAPPLGAQMIWHCTGPYSRIYDLTVVRIENEVARYEGTVDGESYFSEKHVWFSGTSLWYRLSGDRRQWFDLEDFEKFRLLRPGTRFKGAVPAEKDGDKWVWGYQVSIGQAGEVKHPVLGPVEIVPISERRRIYHGDYWSEMITFLMPANGLSVRWVYKDQLGTEECDLAEYNVPQISQKPGTVE